MLQAQTAPWSAEDQEAGYSLPARYFYDEEVFRHEKSKIFFKSWHLVAHVNELRTPGSFVTHDIFEQSVIVIAGRDGELRAFHNVCQHRGNRLLEARRGKTPTLTCGYHAWTYALDGCLRGAPNIQGVAGFQKSDHGLKPVRVERFAS
ncbi:MAG TPA: Rieske (2Fe-2S) protein, partial [Steroidobacteraceae bacterium]|nr:Rieske (2Fe-2S) protein [Steroidobacteraceae bacterium]